MIIPTITIDGPSGTGKGTIASKLSHHLGYHLLDSGTLYRAVAWSCHHAGIDIDNESALLSHLNQLELKIEESNVGDQPTVRVGGRSVLGELRTEACGLLASKLAAKPMIRTALIPYQRDLRRLPGLVADGRDMGSVIYPDASLKVFLDANSDIRAERRYKQLKEKGMDVSLAKIRQDLADRDGRDEHRSIAPLVVTDDMFYIDTSDQTIDDVFSTILGEYSKRGF